MVSKMVVLVLLIPMISFAQSGASDVGVGTEFQFHGTDAGGVVFSKCESDSTAICAVMEKIDNDAPTFKSKKVCTFKIRKTVASTLRTPGGVRTLVVKGVERNKSQDIVSLTLGGASVEISLSCVGQVFQNRSLNTMFDFPLSQSLLSGFKGFTLNQVKLDRVVRPGLAPPAPKPDEKPIGEMI